MSSSTPHAGSGATGATATASDDRHLPQLKTLKGKPQHDHSPGPYMSSYIAVLTGEHEGRYREL